MSRKVRKYLEKQKADRVTGLYDYDATGDTEMSFKKGDVMKLVNKKDADNLPDWVYVKNSSDVKGYVPKNFVRLTLKKPHKSKKKFKAGKRYQAEFDFIATDENEVDMKEGDIVEILKDTGEWLFVKNERTKEEGFIPENYIRSISSSVVEKKSTTTTDILEIVTAKFDYEGESESELSFKEGDEIKVTIRNKDGWWFGKVGDKEGYFPTNYTEKKKKKIQRNDSDILEIVTAKFDYEGASESELSFKEGDEIEVTIRNKDGWWFGKVGDKEGYFPTNYTEKKKKMIPRKQTKPKRKLPPPQQVPPPQPNVTIIQQTRQFIPAQPQYTMPLQQPQQPQQVFQPRFTNLQTQQTQFMNQQQQQQYMQNQFLLQQQQRQQQRQQQQQPQFVNQMPQQNFQQPQYNAMNQQPNLQRQFIPQQQQPNMMQMNNMPNSQMMTQQNPMAMQNQFQQQQRQ